MRAILKIGVTLSLISLLAAGSRARASTDSTSLLRWKLHMDNRFSVVKGSPLGFWGGSLGRTWGPFDREITLGYYWLGKRGTRQLTSIAQEQNPFAEAYPKIQLGVISVGYWHNVLNSRRWRLGFPMELGVGRAHVQLFPSGENVFPLSDKTITTVVPLQAGGYVEWKATRWVGLGLQNGYRLNLRSVHLPVALNGYYYRIRVLVYPAAFKDGVNFVFKGKPLPSPFFKNP